MRKVVTVDRFRKYFLIPASRVSSACHNLLQNQVKEFAISVYDVLHVGVLSAAHERVAFFCALLCALILLLHILGQKTFF